MQRDQHADGQVQAGGQVRHGDPGPGRLAARQPGHAHEAAHPLSDLVQAAPARVRAVLAETADRTVDQARVPCVYGFEVKAQPVLDRRAHVLDQYVADVDQAHQDLARRRGLEVQRQRPFVAVQMPEVGAMTAASGQARRGRVRGPLNADDVGAPVRELPDTGRAGPRDRQIDDADVVQRKLRGHVLLHPCPGGLDETVECRTWQPMQLLQRPPAQFGPIGHRRLLAPATQVLVAGRVVHSIDCPVVLAEGLLALWSGGGLSGSPADRRDLPSAVLACDPGYAHRPCSPRPHRPGRTRRQGSESMPPGEIRRRRRTPPFRADLNPDR